MALTVLKKQRGYGADTITINKVIFSEVCLSGPTRLTGKFAFMFLHFYPNQCILFGWTLLGRILAKPVDTSLVLEAGFDLIWFKNVVNIVLCLSNPIGLASPSYLTWDTWKNLGFKSLMIYLMT